MQNPYYWKLDTKVPPEFDPKLRKATQLMKLVHQGLKPLFEKTETSPLRRPMQVFFASFHGEIEPTSDFLKSCAQKDWARPFLFQNSLHHSTTGFASQQFGLLGPCFSICAISNAQKEILQTGLMQIRMDPRATLLINGESFPAELAEISKYDAEDACEIFYIDERSAHKIYEDRNFFSQLFEKENFVEAYDFLNEGSQVNVEAPS